MEDVSGKRLDWFFREWFIQNHHFDLGIDTVFRKQVGEIDSVGVLFVNHARGVLPIRVRFTFADSSKVDEVYPAEVWSTNTTGYVRRYEFKKKVAKIELDPDSRLVDINRANNVWPRGG